MPRELSSPAHTILTKPFRIACRNSDLKFTICDIAFGKKGRWAFGAGLLFHRVDLAGKGRIKLFHFFPLTSEIIVSGCRGTFNRIVRVLAVRVYCSQLDSYCDRFALGQFLLLTSLPLASNCVTNTRWPSGRPRSAAVTFLISAVHCSGWLISNAL